eukprot:gene14854-16520_t
MLRAVGDAIITAEESGKRRGQTARRLECFRLLGGDATVESTGKSCWKLDTPPGSVVLEGSIADRLRDLEAIVARIKEQRRVSEENFQARMKQHEIEAEQRAVVDRELTEALAKQMSYSMDKIGGHEERLQRLEENSSSNMFIFDDIDRRLVELGAGPAHGAPQGDDLDPHVTTRGVGKKTVRFNPEIVERVERMEAVAQAQSAELQSTQESLTTVNTKLSVQDIVIEDLAKKVDEFEEAFYVITEMKKAADLAEAKEEHSESTASGDAMPVHPREPRASTCTNDPETVFTYADLRGRPDTPQTRTSRGVQAQEEDQEESEVYVRARAGKTSKKKKKTIGRGGNSGGDDSSDGSDDSARGRRKGYDSDDSDSAQRRKKDGLTRDYLNTRIDGGVCADTGHGTHPGTSDVPSYTKTSGGYGFALTSFPSQVVMRERPTIDKLCLSKLDVPRLLIFREKFIRLANANYPEELLLTHYMDSRVLSMVLTTIKTEMRFEDLWDRIRPFGGVLQTEHHLLSNQEVYSVLTYIVRPRTRLEMQKWLGQSVWDATSYSKFKNNRTYIQTYIDYYLQAWTHYRERFEMLVEILYHEDTKPFFPTYIKRKGSDNGLLDYFFNGTPDVQFSKQIREKYIDSEKWERMKDFSAILDTYFRALQKLRDHNKLVEDTVSIFKPDKKSIFTPPMDLEFKKGGTSNFKRMDRVQVLKAETEATKEGELMFPEEDESLDWGMPNVEDETCEEPLREPQGTQAVEHAQADDEFRAVAQGDEDSESEREDAWLAAIQYTPGKKRVCFEFAKRGTCERLKTQGHCPYSHDDEDC